MEIQPIYFSPRCRRWHFLIHITVFEFHGGKEFYPMEVECGHVHVKKTHNVPPYCWCGVVQAPEDMPVKCFCLKRRRKHHVFIRSIHWSLLDRSTCSWQCGESVHMLPETGVLMRAHMNASPKEATAVKNKSPGCDESDCRLFRTLRWHNTSTLARCCGFRLLFIYWFVHTLVLGHSRFLFVGIPHLCETQEWLCGL